MAGETAGKNPIPDVVDTVLTWTEILTFLESRKRKLDGLVFSGGEPLLQEDLTAAISVSQTLGYAVKIDTNGTLPDQLNRLIQDNPPDYIAMDLKAGPVGLHEATGTVISFERIRKSIDLILSSGIVYEFRTTLIPGLHTLSLFEQMLQLIEGAETIVLQNLSGFPTYQAQFASIKPLPKETLELYRSLADQYVKKCLIRC